MSSTDAPVCTCRGDLRGWAHLSTCPKYVGEVDDAKAAADEIGDCGFTERESAIRALRTICRMVEHDSPVYCVAVEELSALASEQGRAASGSPVDAVRVAARRVVENWDGERRDITTDIDALDVALRGRP